MKHNICIQSGTEDFCPITKVSQILGDLWIMMIIKELLEGDKRFNELHRNLLNHALPSKVSTKTLSERLKLLRESGFVEKVIESESNILITYKLTDKGKGLEKVFDSIKEYGEEYLK